MDEPTKKPGLDRRALLTGVAIGAVGAGAAAVGVGKLHATRAKLVTPDAVEGGPAQIGETFADSRPSYAGEAKAPAGAPNIIVVILDDVGFADLGCYGGEIATPSFDALAADGLRYAKFRTCAMCSPTRASLLTGLNHHSAGMGWLADIDSGYPGYRGEVPTEVAMLPEVLRGAGYATFLSGKWHLLNAGNTSIAGPFTNWPTSRGFDRAYWYQGHSSDYFKPGELFEGNAPVDTPQTPDYYLSDDLTTRAMTYIRTQTAVAPDKPFYLQLAFSGAHSPLQAPAADSAKYAGKYDAGWDVVRAARLAKQKKLGVVPSDTKLPPLSFGAKPWAELTPVEQKAFARYMEVYAATVTGLDTNLGRLMATLDQLGIRDNTMIVVMSDNGGSPEGTDDGTPNVFASAYGRPVPVAQAAAMHDIMGTDATFPHYPRGWACVSNTPFRLYKQYAHLGGVSDPLIISWPKKIAAQGEVRSQFVHVVDLYPTLLEAAGVARPANWQGKPLKPLEGKSIVPTFASAGAPTRTSQYYELGGNRAYEEGNWRLVTRHTRGSSFDSDKWELYDTSREINELTDLAAAHPDKVKEMVGKWEAAARKYQVYPLDDRALIVKLSQDKLRSARKQWDIRPPIDRLGHDASPAVCGASHSIEFDIDRPAGKAGDGVLLAHGSHHAGYVIWIDKGRLIYETALLPWREAIVADRLLPTGRIKLRYVQKMTARPFDGSGSLFINGTEVATHKFERCLLAPGYDPFSIGSDIGNQVSAGYTGSNPFGGSIHRVLIDIDTSPIGPIDTMNFLKSTGNMG